MADVYDEHIRLAQRLEELGWHSYCVIEHQNSPVGRITAVPVTCLLMSKHWPSFPPARRARLCLIVVIWEELTVVWDIWVQ